MNRKRDTVTTSKQTHAGFSGFTIVELLIVIVVIGVLAALTYVGYNAVQEQAKRTKVKHDIVQITNAIDTARGKTGKVLYKITGNTVTDFYCATQDTDPALLPKTHRCWTDYYAALNAISQASGVTLQNVVDPWGRPYMIDENEGFNGPCYQDTVAMYPRPFKQQWVPDGSTPGENVPLSGFSGCTEPTSHTPTSPTTPASPTTPTPTPTTITTGLIAWWPFNGNAKDISGNGHDGVIYGGVTGVTGQNGTANNAYLFDGSSGYISSNESLLNGTRAYSFGGWVYFTDGQASRAGFAGQNDSVENLWYNGTDSRFYQGGATTSCVYLAKNTWHFIYITYDGTATRQYANGTQCDSSNNSRSDSSYNFNIGGGGISDSTGNYFKGRIDDIRIYNRALSGSEINTLYNNGAY